MTANHRVHIARLSTTGLALVFTAAFAVVATAQTPAVVAKPPSAGVAAPAATGGAGIRIIMIDRNIILQRSSAGKDMVSQTQNLSKQADTQFRAEQAQLQTEATQLQQQLAILAPDVRDQKEKDFTAKEQSLQNRIQQRQADIQAGFNKAAQQLELALEPILVDIMKERNANMVLERSAVILAAADVDVSAMAVDRLDKKLPHIKVELVPGSGVVPGLAGSAVPAAARPAPAARPAAGK